MKYKMNKKAFVARDFVVASLLFSGLLALTILAVAGFAAEYDNTAIISEDFSDKFNKFEDNTERIGGMYDAATSEEGLSFIGTFEVLFSSTFTIISLVFSGITAADSQLLGFGDFFGIPSSVSAVFFTLVLGVLTTLIVFIVISSLSRRDL